MWSFSTREKTWVWSMYREYAFAWTIRSASREKGGRMTGSPGWRWYRRVYVASLVAKGE